MAGTDLANPDDYTTGLEDFDATDAVIPRLAIVHTEGEFKDSLSNEQFSTIQVIILGLVKQRVLWHPQVDDDDWPMCRSTNFKMGYPNLSDKQPKEKRFPWGDSGFDASDFVEDGELVSPLACDGCTLKEWGSHPDGKKPYCSEQWTLPVLYTGEEGEMPEIPAIITFQKTGLKSLKSYLTSFARSRSAAFQAVTQFGLELQRRGTTTYSTPTFRKVGDTDDARWRDYSVQFRVMQEFLTASPDSRDDKSDDKKPVTAKAESKKAAPVDDDAPADTVDADVVEETPEKQAKADKVKEKPETKAEPKAEPEASSDDDDDDDLPF